MGLVKALKPYSYRRIQNVWKPLATEARER